MNIIYSHDRSHPKCPKCRSEQLIVTEHWSSSIEWMIGDNHEDGILQPGSPLFVTGKCQDCGYSWRFRGLQQAPDEWFENNEEKE